jgi:cytochrome c-type biogenesis protein CcmH/NrfG
MKKRTTYAAILSLFAIAIALIILKYKREEVAKESMLYEIIPRKGNAMQSTEWMLSKKMASRLIQKIRQNPSDLKSLNALSAIYLQEARSSGNYSYYDKAAMNCVNWVLKKDAKNFTGQLFIYLSIILRKD